MCIPQCDSYIAHTHVSALYTVVSDQIHGLERDPQNMQNEGFTVTPSKSTPTPTVEDVDVVVLL